jgi:hypothetical protein
VFSAVVVEAIDVLKEGVVNVLAHGLGVSPDQFCLEGLEEGLDDSIVITVASAAHRYLETHFPQPLLIVLGTVLAAPISVVKTAWWRVAKGHGIVVPDHVSSDC